MFALPKLTAVAVINFALFCPAFAETTQVASPANSQADMVMPELDDWMKFLQDEGYKTIDQSTSDQLLIESAAEGSKFHVQFFGCDGIKDCQSVQLWSGFDMDNGTNLELINAWNRDKRYGKAYLDDEMDPFLEMDINMTGGLPLAAVQENLGLWTQILSEFQDHIDW